MSFVRSLLFALAVAGTMRPSCSLAGAVDAMQHDGHVNATSPSLIDEVRAATDQFRDVRNAAPDYQPILGCVSGPDEGAMGLHYLNGALFMDANLDPSQPEALIYEVKNSIARLVGVEFIVLASVWHEKHSAQEVPVLEGQLLQFVDSPNRFGLPPFYELHVWAWRDNPHGSFVDWNPNVTCDGR